MTLETMQQYRDLFNAVWKNFKKDLPVVETIENGRDPRWEEIVKRYQKIEKDAPECFKRYAGNLVNSTIEELEWIWRGRKK